MKLATLVFLVKYEQGNISEICLAMKKRGFGVNKYNGVGGKVGDKFPETIEQAAQRETMEEIGVQTIKLVKVARFDFLFEQKSDWDQQVHVFLCSSWQDEPIESEEMCPGWFKVSEIPYDRMWSDDHLWLPRILSGEKLTGEFTFDNNGNVLQHSLSSDLG